MADFIFDYFCKPILEHEGYNLVNTLTYGLILLALAIFVIYPFFTKKKIHFDKNFATAALLFVVAGSSFRILEDLSILPRSCSPLDLGFYTITPGVYILFGTLTMLCLYASIKLAEKTKKDYTFYFKIFGAALALPFLLFVFSSFKDWLHFGMILVFWGTILTAAYLTLGFFKKQLMNSQINALVVAGQAFDGTATFVATQVLNCGEQHPVSDVILGFFPFSFVLIKVIIALALIYYTDKEEMPENMKGFIKVVIIILGFAPGIRDALTVGVGTCA